MKPIFQNDIPIAKQPGINVHAGSKSDVPHPCEKDTRMDIILGKVIHISGQIIIIHQPELRSFGDDFPY